MHACHHRRTNFGVFDTESAPCGEKDVRHSIQRNSCHSPARRPGMWISAQACSTTSFQIVQGEPQHSGPKAPQVQGSHNQILNTEPKSKSCVTGSRSRTTFWTRVALSLLYCCGTSCPYSQRAVCFGRDGVVDFWSLGRLLQILGRLLGGPRLGQESQLAAKTWTTLGGGLTTSRSRCLV